MNQLGRTLKHAFAGVMLSLVLHNSVMAVNGDVRGEVSLADQVVAEARQLELTQVTSAIDMMLSREQEVVRVSSGSELARYYNKLAELNSTINRLDQQQKFAEKGLQLIGDELVPIGAELNYNLGLVYEMNTDYVEARKYYEKGLYIAETTGNRVFQGRGKLYIAGLYTSQEDYDKALNIMREAFALSEEVKDPGLSWEVNNEIGLLYSYMGDDAQALEFHQTAIAVSQQLQMKELTINSLYNAAMTNIDLKRFDDANKMLGQMLLESKNSTEKSNMYSSYKGFAYSARAAAENSGTPSPHYKRALDYMLKAEEYLPYVQQVLHRVEHHMHKAYFLHKLEQTNRALEELAIAERYLPEDQHGENSGFGVSIFKLKADFFAELGQFEAAYQWLDKYVDAYKKYRDKEKEDKALKLRMSFDMERNEVRNEMLEKENEIKALQLQQAKNERQIQTFFLIALALLSLVLIFVMYRQFHSRRQLKSIAETDSLTGLFNRRYAFSNGDSMLKQCNVNGKPFSIFLFDLDHFKSVNDTYGHPAGDNVLKSVAEISKNCLRGTDVLARIGGEEFIAILPGVELEMAEYIAGRLKDKLESSQQEYDGNKFFVTASFGVAAVREHDDFERLTQRADKALYQAKDNGRNCVALAS